MDSKSKKLILNTLSYFDLFNYPLTRDEAWQFSEIKQSKESFYKDLQKLNISSYKSFYFLEKRKSIVKKRLEKEKISSQKLKKAIKIINKLSLIPTVNFIGISGSLAMKNSNLEDDIDIFVICQSNLVWFTRLILAVYLSFLGVYRKKHEKNPKDKICLNLIIGNKNTAFFKNRQNLYIAHEIVQLIPIFQQENSYFDFINKNNWILSFLPNYDARIQSYKIPFYKSKKLTDSILINILYILRVEKIAKFIQWNYMKKDVTLETIEDNFLAFHPVNFEKKVSEFLNQK